MIKIGMMTVQGGPYQVLGDDSIRCAKLVLDDINYEVAGQPIELVIEGTNAIDASATQACQKLVHEAGVDIVVGPVSGDEAVATRAFANEHPDRVFINGAAGSQQIYAPAENFYSFWPNGVQFISGLGGHCYESGFERVVILSEAYSFTFAQVGAFALEYCKAGGTIVDIIWCPLGTEDFRSHIHRIPANIDAICSFLGGTDGVRFIEQYREEKGSIPIIGGTLQGDPTTLHFVRDYADLLTGVLTASPICDTAPDSNWQTFLKSYQALDDDNRLYSPSLLGAGYYMNMKALMQALDMIDGDLSNGQAKLRDALLHLQLDGLTCQVRLDRHRFPIIDNFVNEIAVNDDGILHTRMVKRIENVDSTLGYSDEEWLALGHFSIQNIPCGRFSQKKLSFEDIIKRSRKDKKS